MSHEDERAARQDKIEKVMEAALFWFAIIIGLVFSLLFAIIIFKKTGSVWSALIGVFWTMAATLAGIAFANVKSAWAVAHHKQRMRDMDNR